MELVKENNWQATAVSASEKLSMKIEEAFHESVKGGRSEIKEPTQDDLKDLLNINLDYLFGTAVAVAAQYISDGEDFENIIVNHIREKFKILRDINQEKANGTKRENV